MELTIEDIEEQIKELISICEDIKDIQEKTDKLAAICCSIKGTCKTCTFLGDRGVHCGQHNRTVPSNGYCWLYQKEK